MQQLGSLFWSLPRLGAHPGAGFLAAACAAAAAHAALCHPQPPASTDQGQGGQGQAGRLGLGVGGGGDVTGKANSEGAAGTEGYKVESLAGTEVEDGGDAGPGSDSRYWEAVNCQVCCNLTACLTFCLSVCLSV